MGAIFVRTYGRDWTLNTTTSADGNPVSVYSDAGFTTALVPPVPITDDVTWYVRNGRTVDLDIQLTAAPELDLDPRRVTANLFGSVVDLELDTRQLQGLSASGSVLTIRYSSGWPARSTVTTDSNATVLWIGPDISPPTVGGSGMGLDDVFLGTP